MSKLAVLLLLSFAVLQAHGRDIELVRSDTGIVTGVHNDTVDVTGGAGNYACNYHFEVQTGDEFGAGTDAWITFGLYRQDGSGWTTRIDAGSPFYPFERCYLDTFDINSWCMNPCHLTLHIEMKGPFPDWLCSWVRVTVSGAVSYQQLFQVNQWISPFTNPTAVINYCGNHATAAAVAA